jgi:hypothetical protein
MRAIPRTQTLLSYAMNNYWHTNFKAEQGGPVAFQFALRPHGAFRPEEAVRLGAERRALLVVAPAHGPPLPPPLVTLAPGPVVVTSVRPTSDGAGWLIQLLNPAAEAQAVVLTWRRGERVTFSRSDSFERPGAAIPGAVEIPARGTAVVRADRVRPAGRR